MIEPINPIFRYRLSVGCSRSAGHPTAMPGAGGRGNAVLDARHRCRVPRHAVVRQRPDAPPFATRRPRCRSQTGAAAHGKGGLGGPLGAPAHEHSAPAEPDLPLSVAQASDRATEPCLVCKCDLLADAPRLSLSGCDYGRGKRQGAGPATVQHHGCLLLRRRTGRGLGPLRRARGLESQFASSAFTSVLRDAGVRIRMGGRGRWIDNVFIEWLWRSIKHECVYLNAFETRSELRAGLAQWIAYYNTRRPHSGLAGQTPAEAYRRSVAADGDFLQSPQRQVAKSHRLSRLASSSRSYGYSRMISRARDSLLVAFGACN